jgi:phosphatidylglycerol:prolipoprotein diacylglycerol transferase
MQLLFEPGMLTGGNIRIAQLVSLIGVLAGLVLIIWRRMSGTVPKQAGESKKA